MKIDYDFKNHPWYLKLLVLLVLLILVFGLFVATSALFMIIWNNVIPSAFGLTTISLKQSIDLLLLAWLVKMFTNTCTKGASTLSITDKKD